MRDKPFWVGITYAHPIDIVDIYEIDTKSMLSKASIEWFSEKLRRRGDLFLVARNRITGEVVGYISGRAVPMGQNLEQYIPNYYFISRLAVEEKHRHLGIGTALVTKMEESARSLGFSGIIAGVRRSNRSAIAFYTRLGYTIDTSKESKWYYDFGNTIEERRRYIAVKNF